jgi:DNA-binding CsgD family transcriptional regulator
MITLTDKTMLAVLAGICFVSYLYFGAYILFLAPKGRPNRAFFYFCEFASLWSLCYVFYYLSGDERVRGILERVIYAGMAYAVLLLRFFIIFTDFIKNKRLLRFTLIIIWLPELSYLFASMLFGALPKDSPFGFWYILPRMIMFFYNSTSVILLLIYYLRPAVNRSKKQGVIPAVSGALVIPCAWASDTFFAHYGILHVLPFWLLLWVFVVLYSIRKYRFLSITPTMINKDISDNIEEGIILLDQDLKIVFKNSALLNMINVKDDDVIGLQDIIREKNILNNGLSDLIQTKNTSFSLRINFISKHPKKNILTDIKVKKIIDDYKDITGFLIVASRVKSLDQLREQFNISRRELEIIHHVMVGCKNREIAKMLDITESTVKTHVASIYGKLGVKNRIELLNLLSEYNVIALRKGA